MTAKSTQEKQSGKFLLGTAMVTAGLIAASPVDEIACLAIPVFGPVCAAIAAVVSTPIGLGVAAFGAFLIYQSSDD